MKLRRLAIFSIFVLFISCMQEDTSSIAKIHLHSGWTFSKLNSDSVFPAIVPGCVHTDLIKNDLIPDPYYRDNEEKVQWVENEDWVYQTKFEVPEDFLSHERIDLVFEGLDTYAEVYLDNKKIFEADNMFRCWKVDLTGKLSLGSHELKIIFRSPVRVNAVKASMVRYQLPEERAYSRKAPYQFGWDWGPRLVTSGIWRPVYLQAWNVARIGPIQIITDQINDEIARCKAVIEVEAFREAEISCNINIGRDIVKSKKVKLKEGPNRVIIPFLIKDPEQWWTHDLGNPFLYELTTSINSGNTKLEEKKQKFGLRTIELVQDPDSTGKSFYFKLNGIPVFMKGANYIPQDNFPSRVSPARHEALIESAISANMNMLRVWGGGIYEDDLFYDLCDENGILVWQDFMFACTMYPGDSSFVANVRQEAIDNVIRLRNHPSIALWCGNNEVDEGWHNWGWQKRFGYSEKDSKEIWGAYQKIFHKVLPGVIKKYDKGRIYWPSSPKIGWGHEECMYQGDMHYWGVWWGKEPFDVYKKKVGRFMSEYGFQGFPDMQTIHAFTSAEDLQLESHVMDVHQKHPFGMENIQLYMKRDYKVPDSFEDYVYVSQLNQAEGIRTALEAHRRARPFCMGTLYWQLNDCWPVISWSSIDYYNRWKALHYFTRKAFADILVSPVIENEKLRVYIVSDKRQDVEGRLTLTLFDFTGSALWSSDEEIVISGNSSDIYWEEDTSLCCRGHDLRNIVFHAKLATGDQIIYDNNLYFIPVKRLALKPSDLTLRVTSDPKGWEVSLETGYLTKNIRLSLPKNNGRFSDNYFDLIPGETKVIRYLPGPGYNAGPERFLKDLQVKTLVDVYQ